MPSQGSYKGVNIPTGLSQVDIQSMIRAIDQSHSGAGNPQVGGGTSKTRDIQLEGGNRGVTLDSNRGLAAQVGKSSGKLGPALVDLLQKYQNLGTKPFQEQAINASDEQANRVLAGPGENLIGASPSDQRSVISGRAGAVEPTISGANRDMRTFSEQISSLKDFVDQVQAQEERQATADFRDRSLQADTDYRNQSLALDREKFNYARSTEDKPLSTEEREVQKFTEDGAKQAEQLKNLN